MGAMGTLLSVFAIFIPALLLPGPDFVAVVRSSMTRGTSAGLRTTIGVSLGLALYALPAAEVLPRAMTLAQDFAKAPTIALGAAKRQFEAASAQTFEQALEFEASIQPLMVQTEDFKEGTRSFKEKRPPIFTGN